MNNLTFGSPQSGFFAIENDGDSNIASCIGNGWRGDNPPVRLRLSRAARDGNGAQHFLINPYQYGIAFEYGPAGTVEWWVGDFSIHAGDSTGKRTGRLWVGDQLDSGGLFARAWSKGTLWSEVASQTFGGLTHGDLRLRVVNDSDCVRLAWGSESDNRPSHVFRKDGLETPAVETNAVVLVSPNGNRFRITVNNNGRLKSSKVVSSNPGYPCPAPPTPDCF